MKYLHFSLDVGFARQQLGQNDQLVIDLLEQKVHQHRQGNLLAIGGLLLLHRNHLVLLLCLLLLLLLLLRMLLVVMLLLLLVNVHVRGADLTGDHAWRVLAASRHHL